MRKMSFGFPVNSESFYSYVKSGCADIKVGSSVVIFHISGVDRLKQQ